MSHEKVGATFTKKYKDAGGKNVEALPEIISQLIEFLMKFLDGGMCGSKDIKEVTRDSEPWVRRKLINKAMDDGHPRKEAKIIAEAGIDTINATKAADLDNLETT